MTRNEFEDTHKIIYVGGDADSIVSVIGGSGIKKYVVPHNGRKIELGSQDYFKMPHWIEEQVMARIKKDFNIND